MKQLFAIVLCTTAFTLVAVAHPGASGEAMAVSVSLPIVQEPDECELVCHDGESLCAPGQHDAWEPCFAPPNAGGITHGGDCEAPPNCLAGTCKDLHACHPTFQFAATELETLRGALSSGDVAAVRSLLHQHAEQLVVNVDRVALQVVDCTGDYVAHLPLSERLVTSLAEE